MRADPERRSDRVEEGVDGAIPEAVDLALLAFHAQGRDEPLRMARSGPTPELEALLYERPALVDHLKRVEEACA